MQVYANFMRKMKKYTQFSKKIVVAVTAAVTIICAAALVLCYLSGDTAGVVEAANAYIGYATVAFTAYSGNSAVEKWLTRKYGDASATNSDTDYTNLTDSNG